MTWLEEFSVRRPQGFRVLVEGLRRLVDANAPEAELQAYLGQHPIILAQMFPHCHHVIPKERLGGQYEMDFLLPEISSGGTDWIAVELESPTKRIVNKAGRKSAQLEHALQQVRDWKDWIRDNIDYARRPRSQNGLGLEDIDDRMQGLVVIGRRSHGEDDAEKRIKRQVNSDENIDISSWDRVLEWAAYRAEFWDGLDASIQANVLDVGGSRP